MIKLRSMCLLAGVLCTAGGALAADGVKKQVIPDFATTDKASWLLDHTFGVDDLLPPPAGGPGPITSDKAHPCLTTTARDRPIGLRIFPIRSCSPGPSLR